MGNFNRNNSDDRRSFGRRDRPLFKTTCSKCGQECEVPFRPTGTRPVFCSKCFEENEGPDSRRSDRRSSGRPNYDDRRMFEAVCDKCGKKCSVPFQPTSGKPIYCSKCFEDKNPRGSRNTNQYQEQFDAINSKLDQILNILTPTVSPKSTPKPKKLTEKTKVKKTASEVAPTEKE